MDIDTLKKQLGLRLKELRLAKKMKQEDLENYGFSYRYYGKMERGLVNPTLETLLRLCEIFDVTLPELFIFLDSTEVMSEDREAVAVKVGKILKRGSKAKLRKMKVFLDEIL